MSQYIGLVHHLVLTKMEKEELNIDSLEALKKVLKEYEIHTKIIEEQLEMCKKDHADLRSEMTRLMEENRELYDRLRAASDNAMSKPSQPAVKSDDSDLINNLRSEVTRLTEENQELYDRLRIASDIALSKPSQPAVKSVDSDLINNLKSEVTRLTEDNRELYDRLRAATDNVLSKPSVKSIESDLILSLQQQLSLALAETETVKGAWKATVQELDELKEQLQECQAGNKVEEVQKKLDEAQKDYTEAIRILEEKRNSLKEENDQLNTKCQRLEDEVNKLTSQIDSTSEKNFSLRNSLKESTEQEQQWRSKFLDLEAKYIELDRAYQADKVKFGRIAELEKAEAALRARLDESLRTRDDLQTALERCQERMQEQLRLAAQDRVKVEEAVALVEGACRDREEALARERAAVEEARQLQAELDRLVDEAGRRVVEEGVQLRRSYDSQLAAVRDQLAVAEQDRNRKTVEVEQLQKECERLQGLLTQSQLSIGSEKDKLTGKLNACEANCEQLREENMELRVAVATLEDRCKKNSQRRQKLQENLHKLVKDTQMYQQELAMSEQKADLLNNQLQNTSLDLAKLQSQTILNRGSTNAEEPVVSLSSTLDLYKRLNESYGKMNEKWKLEMTALTDQFEEKLKKVKENSRRRSPDKGNTGAKVNTGTKGGTGVKGSTKAKASK